MKALIRKILGPVRRILARFNHALEPHLAVLAIRLEYFRARFGLGFRLQRNIPAKPKIGFAVLAHERPEYLQMCLDSLFQTELHDWDITFLIQDDGSTDARVREVIETPRNSRYKIVRSYTPKGHNSWGAAFNKAMRKLLEIDDFDIIGSCDGDALFHPEWLDQTLKICLWAKKNHRRHVLGPFSSFNSSDQGFHQVLGHYDSPSGKYVVKVRMGALNYLYFKSDFLKLGFFPEDKDDETLMTEKFSQLKVRNFCTNTSYVEHIGQLSVLNQWRPVPVSRAVFGLNLAPSRWPESLSLANTLGYFKDVIGQKSVDSQIASEVKVDVVIVAMKKDLATLEICIDSVRRNLLHPIGTVFIVSPVSEEIAGLCTRKQCSFVSEDAVLPIRRTDIDYLGPDGQDRSGWLFQQLLKYGMSGLVEQEHYYVIDADTVLVTQQRFEDAGRLVLLHSDEFHRPYFSVCGNLLRITPTILLSCVAHQMFFSVSRLQAMLATIGASSTHGWWESILENVDYSDNSGFSEFETYGQWCMKEYSGETQREYWYNLALSRDQLRDIDTLCAEYGSRYRSVSFHHYQNLQ